VHVLFAGCDLDTDARRFVREGLEIHLSPKAFELLKTLVDSRPRALSKQELLDRIWPGTFVSDASLARAVSEIREAIGEHSRTDGFLQTVHGFGYRFADAGVTVAPAVAPPLPSVPGITCWLVGKDQEFDLGDGDHVIGREPGVAVQLNSPRVSRFHARLVIHGRSASIEDLGSKNGTFVRGARVEARIDLSHGDDIQIGPIRLTFRVIDTQNGTVTEVWNRDASKGD
jgi:DNA-binding winged helix-turn-helix (wHTH) protein